MLRNEIARYFSGNESEIDVIAEYNFNNNFKNSYLDLPRRVKAEGYMTAAKVLYDNIKLAEARNCARIFERMQYTTKNGENSADSYNIKN